MILFRVPERALMPSAVRPLTQGYYVEEKYGDPKGRNQTKEKPQYVKESHIPLHLQEGVSHDALHEDL
ncbi:MAG: hypothetical protein ACE5KK_07510, partial [Candidatus Brocadiales bacterium]